MVVAVPLSNVVLANKVLVCPAWPSVMPWLVELNVPSSVKAPVLAKLMPLATAMLPRKVKAKGSAATVKVGVLKPALKAMAWASTVSVNTTLVPVVTALLKVAVLLLTTSKVLSAALPPTTPCAVMLPKLPASRLKLRVLAVSPLTVCMNFKSPPVCNVTSVNTLTMS